MKTFDRITIEKQAHALRRQEMSRLANAAFTRLSEALRNQHEAWLRRRHETAVDAAIGTPV